MWYFIHVFHVYSSAIISRNKQIKRDGSKRKRNVKIGLMMWERNSTRKVSGNSPYDILKREKAYRAKRLKGKHQTKRSVSRSDWSPLLQIAKDRNESLIKITWNGPNPVLNVPCSSISMDSWGFCPRRKWRTLTGRNDCRGERGKGYRLYKVNEIKLF